MQRHDVLDRAVRRAYMRLAPFLMLMYVVSFLDRATLVLRSRRCNIGRHLREHVCVGRGPVLYHLFAMRISQQPDFASHRPQRSGSRF